jgi:hypothetical protein
MGDSVILGLRDAVFGTPGHAQNQPDHSGDDGGKEA